MTYSDRERVTSGTLDLEPFIPVISGSLIVGVTQRRVVAPCNPDHRPLKWTAERVGERLVEAFRVVARIPNSTRPGGFKNSMPAYTHDAGDLNMQVGSGAIIDTYNEHNRVRIQPSTQEITLMEQAISWPMEYFKNDKMLALAVTGWAEDVVWNRRSTASFGPPPVVLEALQILADDLNRNGIRVA